MKLNAKEWESPNLQPYDSGDCDAVDARNTLDIFRAEILPGISEFFLKSGVLLDVGCGNGRFSAEMYRVFSRIYAIDPHRGISSLHLRPNITFRSTTFEEFELEESVDMILFFGSFFAFQYTGYREVLEKAKSLLAPHGHIVIIDNAVRIQPKKERGYYSLERLGDEVGLTTVKEFVQKNGVHRINVLESV